jgi:uncharacterized membrane protein
MSKTRLEAFSDGVLAIIITIMVLELKPPHPASWAGIQHLIPDLVSYILSFAMVGIYWGNHHHLLHTALQVNSRIIWANLHLLFWLSLVPFCTAWMGETSFASTTVAAYAIVLDLCGIAYYVLLQVIEKSRPVNASLAIPLTKQKRKGIRSLILYTTAIPAAFIHPAVSGLLFVTVAVLWWWPDRNIEQSLKER